MGYPITAKQRLLAFVLVSIMIAAPWGAMPFATDEKTSLEFGEETQHVNQLTQ